LRRRLWAILAFALVLASARHSRAVSVSGTPHREDHGDLIVLHVYGSYYEMGRQQVELLGPVARRMFDYHREKYRSALQAGGWRVRVMDAGMSVLPWLGPLYEESGAFDEMNGMADALGVSRSDFLRAEAAASFGSTVFVATRSATADGGAIIGRNVDWDDGNGTMRPVLTHFHPDNGDLAYIIGGWPLISLPAIGINEKGFALSFNFFVVDEILGIPPQMRDRRALQTAATVADGLRVFTEVRKRAMPSFMVMADATGDIAMIECTPSEYAVFRPDGDWFAQANHARTEAMIPFDRYRAADSFRRRAAMEAAVRPHLGAITPGVAAQILRDRSNSAYINDDVVANPAVLNSAVLQPATKTLWHSTKMQPQAPFGEMLPFSVGVDVSSLPPLPVDPRLGAEEMRREAAVMAEARWAVRQFRAGDLVGARMMWDRLAARQEPLLDPDRLAWGRAAVRAQQGQLEEADAVLETIRWQQAPFEVGGSGLVLRAWIADRLGRREAALRGYRLAQEYVDAHPEYSDRYTQELRRLIAAGLAERQQADLPELPDLQRVPP